MEPLLALRTAVRAALIADPAVTALVPADRIRAGWVREGEASAILLRDVGVDYLGRAAGGQLLAEATLDLHVWADGADLAQRIGGAVVRRLFDAPAVDGADVDRWSRPGTLAWIASGADGEMAHGAATLSAVLRWRA